ncbi:MAG: hypothetical protein PVJ38_02520 [Candidatus Bathyarchaeota archaeon]|jgi:hypothetical protein
MSFMYGQFGTGFGRTRPPGHTLRLMELLETRGQDVTVVRLTETGTDGYGQPIYSESKHAERAFIRIWGDERDLPPGTFKGARIRLYMKPWAALKEEGCELLVDGVRYHITGVSVREVYLEAEAER